MAGVRQFDEAAAMEAALALFWRQGLAATSMPDLAGATGVQRGSLYNAYGDKEAIFLRAFDLYAERFLAAARAGLAGETAEAVLSGFFRAAIASMTSGTPPRGCLTTKTASDGSVALPRVRERLKAFLDALTALVEEALARPDLRAGLAVAPDRAARVVVTFTRGLAVMERLDGDRDGLAALADALVASLVRGPA
ncbi:TetR/AcrR family transcriptional regulator [uncultured Methylobacterium sp.]|jgi:TetR/AcrR family transcriptional repressor of nem operon|uniref:TetR/AcrR family transcriptional regulator n=1 Tax=uncultured Methylobacterium sp. TaxID=157278 RepID=UPI00260D3C69|nr:TetR/AcrR family transcriptional regulator [uncultured Methylobacterium sp.]